MFFSRRLRNCGVNGWVLIIGGMLVLFAVSIALAVMFPYQGLPPPKSDDIVAVETQKLEGASLPIQSDTLEETGTGNPDDEIIIMKKGQITTEGKDETSSGEHVLLSHDEAGNKPPQVAEPETHVLFSHKEPADESPQVTEPEDGEDEQEEKPCASLLQQADIDNNKMLTTSEYLSFMHSMHDSNILSLENLSDEYASLSFGLRLNFLHQQCKCPQALSECCEYEKGVYVGDESAAAEFCRMTMEVGLGLDRKANH
mmetsp:Transcript_26079/g.58770  ORF Transcript_26079/g.58770 Transcript_26079/m.58770 type:complete len:256 (-) Transcript_26079:242-1009(-)